MGKFKTRAFEGEYEVNSIKTIVFVIVNRENLVPKSTKIIIIQLRISEFF
jgi:hypothetical protein